MFAIDRLPFPVLLALANMLVLARVTARLPSWAWTYATAGRRGIRRYSLGAEMHMLAAQARWTRNSDPAWLRRVRAWHVQRRRHAQRPPTAGGVAFAVVLLLALCGCAAPLVHQQRLAALHSRAAAACKTQVLTCAALMPCSQAVRTALSDWQAVSAAASKGDDAGEAAALVVAASSEVAVYGVCKEVK